MRPAPGEAFRTEPGDPAGEASCCGVVTFADPAAGEVTFADPAAGGAGWVEEAPTIVRPAPIEGEPQADCTVVHRVAPQK